MTRPLPGAMARTASENGNVAIYGTLDLAAGNGRALLAMAMRPGQRHCTPGPAVESGILYPMPVGLPDGHEVSKDPFSGIGRTGGEQAACDLNQIARPHQVVATQIVVALGRAPRIRQTCDDCAGR